METFDEIEKINKVTEIPLVNASDLTTSEIAQSILTDIKNRCLEGFTNVVKDFDHQQILDTFNNIDHQQILDTTKILAEEYWRKFQLYGFGVAIIDDIIITFIIVRLIIFAFRYNLITSIALNVISAVSAYVWYSAFLNAIDIYEDLLYLSSYTYRLGVDATQIEEIMEGQVEAGEYALRITNPVGVLAYAIFNGATYEKHNIDIFSMLVTKIPAEFRHQHLVEGTYYYVYRELGPMALRAFTSFAHTFTNYLVYAYMTRMNRRFCPYLLRWHWTMLMLLKFIEPFPIHVLFRIVSYSERILIPKMEAMERFNLSIARYAMELDILQGICFCIIICHLSFFLFAMFHALWGQYFYLPFVTENVELHIGPRDKNSLYSGGYTAWQDRYEQPKGNMPKFWYGVFGRGTRTRSIIYIILRTLIYIPLRTLIYDPVYWVIKQILKPFRRNR